MPVLYAIGDVHGRRDLLEALLGAIRDDARARGEEARIVFLGDVIDRGPESRQALDLVMETLRQSPGSRLILGNHEEFLLRFLDPSEDRERVAVRWLQNGGLTTLASYGFGHGEHIDTIATHFRRDFQSHIETLRNAEWRVETRCHFLVHGGVDPALPFAEQDPETTRWIRHEFLDFKGPLEKIVVHGHTPTDSSLPEIHSNRVAVDTGAVFSGHLTCAIFDDDGAPPRFLATDDHGARIEVTDVRPLAYA